MAHLYAGTILIIDLTSGVITREQTNSYTKAFLGGRGINIKLFYDQISPGVDPLSPDNVLVFGVGPLGGTSISTGRTEVTAKSPETGYLGSSNFGGFFGGELKFAGYDHIVITGKAEKPAYIWIENDRVEIRNADSIWGRDTYETPELIRREIGNPEAKVACIGPAGENRVRFSSIQHEMGHGAGRTGLGAVMGSKNLKAIAVRGTGGLTLRDPEEFLSLAAELKEVIRSDPMVVRLSNEGLTRFDDEYVEELKARSMTFSAAETDSEPKVPSVHAIYKKFRPKRAGCYGCPVQCMDHYQAGGDKDGVISCEVYTSFGPQVRCFDTDASLENSILCQRYGLDAVSTAGIISWLMELKQNGLITESDTDGIAMEWGSPGAIRGMIERIAHRRGIGEILAEGIVSAAQEIGRGSEAYANQTKGLPMVEIQNPGWTPYIKGGALAIAVGPRGDSMRSLPSEYAVDRARDSMASAMKVAGVESTNDPQNYEGKPEIVVAMEDIVTINDLLSTCKWMGGWAAAVLSQEHQAALFTAGSGIETSVEELFHYAQKVRTMERAYEAGEGLTSNQDSLPKRFFDTPIENGPWEGAILDSDAFQEMKRHYYSLRGWDPETGIPSEETLRKLGLDGVADALNPKGKPK